MRIVDLLLLLSVLACNGGATMSQREAARSTDQPDRPVDMRAKHGQFSPECERAQAAYNVAISKPTTPPDLSGCTCCGPEVRAAEMEMLRTCGFAVNTDCE